MNSKDFQKFREDFLNETTDLSDLKRIEYTVGNQDDDVFTNFKEIGKRLNLDPVAVLGVYLFKHIDSLTSFFKHKKTFSEPIDGRVSDIINYLILLLGLLDELNNEDKNFMKRSSDEFNFMKWVSPHDPGDEDGE